MVFKKKHPDYSSQEGLIKACKENDSKAQLRLYDQYFEAMYTVSINMVKDSHLAEDLMQEAFLSAFSKIKSFKGEVSFGAWLKRIVINKCLDYLKKKKVYFEELDNQILADEITVEEDQKAATNTANSIKEEIKMLPDGYRAILTLHLLEGYDHKEISQILGISSSTSRSQYTRAKALLVKHLNSKNE